MKKPFSFGEVSLRSVIALLVVAWFAFGVMAYVNGLAGDLFSYILFLITGNYVNYIIITLIPIIVSAPLIEEATKNYFYRRMNPFYGLFLSASVSIGEAFIFWSQTAKLDWGQLVGRMVFPHHVFYFLISYRYNFSMKGQLLATTFHFWNNLAVVSATGLIVWPFWWTGQVFWSILYGFNFLIGLYIARHVLNEKELLGPVS